MIRKPLRPLVAAITVAVSTSLALPSGASAQEADEEAVRALLENVASWMEAGDFAALDEVYAPGEDVHIIEGAGVNHGWKEYRDSHLKPELESFENFSYSYFDVEPHVRGDVAWAGFRYELSVDTARGHIEMEGRGTAVLERMDGDWRIVRTHTSGRRKQ
jgi:ketosteroid isomerase-like protein